MKKEHSEWIAAYRSRFPERNVYGKCKEAVQEMAKTFPELKKVRGHIFDMSWGQRSHWWLVDDNATDNTIVDPTRSQFPAPMHYEEWQLGTEVLVGKCMECGIEIWDAVQTLDVEPVRKTFCSEGCEEEFTRVTFG
jgi:hypothetical protein